MGNGEEEKNALKRLSKGDYEDVRNPVLEERTYHCVQRLTNLPRSLIPCGLRLECSRYCPYIRAWSLAFGTMEMW